MHHLRCSSWTRTGCLAGAILLLTTFGCLPQQEPSGETASEAAAASDEATPRETVGKTTQEVLVLQEALASGGEPAETSVTSTNPLLQSADAYRTSVAKLGAMAVEQAIQVRNAQSIQDPRPLTHEQFMAEIIKPGQPDGIQLAMLPYYQEYAWDEATQKLVVVDFPARVEQREQQR